MPPYNPSDKENEYFARMEYERLKALAAKQSEKEAKDKLDQLKKLHYMHCPKCGRDLAAITYKGVSIDKCTSCEGIWLDAGELETIVCQEDESFARKILKTFK